MRPDGTRKMADAPAPRRKYPVRSATLVRFSLNSRDIVRVLAARIGPRAVARIAAKQRINVMRSRRHNGQLSGSLGSSEG